ncbi:D-alanyl-D-alanine carboxypeptidase family protein [Vineibacter terrae]|uniref:D-alanyl-D-alanine carboxypeptidase family protein n=1 Tax=Vineibacter terrae TaxID=2586908 RepID=UPI002E33D778|nr:D-alanyl-D-alanine carboxypeptidase family protein [Vineibacter terrae]HEX2884860.1 D-alanyl-D-alanine carboxypeptidase family protein [Vineibacter terrae]
MPHRPPVLLAALLAAPLLLVAAPLAAQAQQQEAQATKPGAKPKTPPGHKGAGASPKAGPPLDTLPPSQIGIGTLARFAYLIDATTDAVLLFKDADKPMMPSSMAKMMTVYLVFEELKAGRLKPDTRFRVSERARSMGGSRMFVEINSEITIDDLIKGVITLSGNDACVVLAEGMSGTEETFAARMNKRAKELGMTGSVFKNASGWPVEGMYVTARDLAVLAKRTIEDFPEYYRYYNMTEFTWNNIRQENRNRLLGLTPGTDGLKTGHSEDAGYGLTASAIRDGRRLILVVNGLSDMRSRTSESARLMEWGFREYSNKVAFRTGETVALADVWLGEAGKVPLVAAKPIAATVPVGQEAGVRVKVEYEGPVRAPIRKGERIGKAVVQAAAGANPVEIPLYAGADVPRLGPVGRAFGVIKHYLFGWMSS